VPDPRSAVDAILPHQQSAAQETSHGQRRSFIRRRSERARVVIKTVSRCKRGSRIKESVTDILPAVEKRGNKSLQEKPALIRNRIIDSGQPQLKMIQLFFNLLLAFSVRIGNMNSGRLVVDELLVNRVRSGRKQP